MSLPRHSLGSQVLENDAIDDKGVLVDGFVPYWAETECQAFAEQFLLWQVAARMLFQKMLELEQPLKI
jgi:hypothetical protein